MSLRYPITVSGFLRQRPQTQSLLVHPLAAVQTEVNEFSGMVVEKLCI
jgi:hypothetical protein